MFIIQSFGTSSLQKTTTSGREDFFGPVKAAAGCVE